MTDSQSKIDRAAEEAYAAAAEKSGSKPVTTAEAAKDTSIAEAVSEAVKVPAKTAPVAKKSAPKAKAKASAAKKPVAAKKAASVKKTTKTTTPKTQAKQAAPAAKKDNKTMATKTETTKTTMQDRVKATYGRATEFAGEIGEFSKGNMEAVVESGKILAGGVQDMAREAVEDTKTVFQTATEDMRLMAAAKSPTEFLKLQGDLMRRNFDAMVQYGSKRTEANIKLANDAFAPISNRMSVAAEKISKAA